MHGMSNWFSQEGAASVQLIFFESCIIIFSIGFIARKEKLKYYHAILYYG